jgi:hypothetical protein
MADSWLYARGQDTSTPTVPNMEAPASFDKPETWRPIGALASALVAAAARRREGGQ